MVPWVVKKRKEQRMIKTKNTIEDKEEEDEDE
jgi:hypothetical protein